MRVTCTNCGQDHPTWDCRAAKRSTAARKDVQTGLASKDVRDNSTARVGGSLQGRHLNREDHKPQAGTQALPVDTNPVQDAKAAKVNMVATIATEPAQEAQILRPGPKFDKRAYMREYMRKRRAKAKERRV